MAVNRSSNLNRSFDLSASVAETETDFETGVTTMRVDTYDTYASASTGPAEGDTDNLGLALNAEGIAVGEDTLVSLSAEGTVTRSPMVDSVEASMTTTAIGVSQDQAYASATSSIALIGGAERTFTLNYGSTILHQESQSAAASSTSTAYLYAATIDEYAVAADDNGSDDDANEGNDNASASENESPATFAPEDPAEGEPLTGFDAAFHEEQCGCNDDYTFSLDGNLALFDVDFSVFADDGFIATDLYSFAVEDQFSNVTMNATLIAG